VTKKGRTVAAPHSTAPTQGTEDGDLLNTLLKVGVGSALHQLRARRSAATTHTQRSYDALFAPTDPAGLTPAERHTVALRVASQHREPALIAHYAAALRREGVPDEQLAAAAGSSPDALSPRLAAIVRHTDLLTVRPATASPADLARLRSAGLSTAQVVTVSQLAAFVSYQTRLVVGLSLLHADQPAGPGNVIGPTGAPDSGFTQRELGWKPWLEPPTVEDVTERQRAALPGQRINSPYFRLLALDPEVLRERTATDNGIFHTAGGLPRAERELAATVTSRVNGCIFCASVHSRFATQLSKRTEDVQRVLDDGPAAQLDPRWTAIAHFSAALTATPAQVDQSHLQRLRALGLADLEILDVVQASAFFAWANRLMLTLGEPTDTDRPDRQPG
jgi:alkylhydroperoxidase domain protein/CMD domain protein